MELSDNKFGKHLIAIGQYKIKYNIVELLVLVQNWSQIGGFFSNINICEGLSLDMEVSPQVETVCLF